MPTRVYLLLLLMPGWALPRPAQTVAARAHYARHPRGRR